MKVTKRQLKQIIKEELETVMDEGFLDFFKKDKGDEAPETAEPTSSASSGPPEPLGLKPKPGASTGKHTRKSALAMLKAPSAEYMQL